MEWTKHWLSTVTFQRFDRYLVERLKMHSTDDVLRKSSRIILYSLLFLMLLTVVLFFRPEGLIWQGSCLARKCSKVSHPPPTLTIMCFSLRSCKMRISVNWVLKIIHDTFKVLEFPYQIILPDEAKDTKLFWMYYIINSLFIMKVHTRVYTKFANMNLTLMKTLRPAIL